MEAVVVLSAKLLWVASQAYLLVTGDSSLDLVWRAHLDKRETQRLVRCIVSHDCRQSHEHGMTRGMIHVTRSTGEWGCGYDSSTRT